MRKVKDFRWWIVVLVALATAINYLDRQTFPVAISEIRKAIPISDGQYGMINSLFLFAYGTMYAVGGRILDVLGSRLGYAVMIVWWSLANVFHGLVSSVMGLGIARFLLGVGEGEDSQDLPKWCLNGSLPVKDPLLLAFSIQVPAWAQ